MSNVAQQILALDARYNANRAASNAPNFRTQYIRRRSQLLRENAKKTSSNPPELRANYLALRKQILAERYGVVPGSEGSLRSRSMSQRSNSQLTLEGDIANLEAGGSSIVPTVVAEASRALVGDTSIAENYSFAGVHHVFEQQHSNDKNGTGKAVTRLRFAHDERGRLAISNLDGVILLCNVGGNPNESGVVMTLRGHTEGVTDFCWSMSNDVIVSCSLDGDVRVWNANSGECVRIIADSSPILSCCFQPLNNNLVVIGNAKGIIQVINISTGMYLKTGNLRMYGAVTSLCSDNSGRLLWVADDKGYVLSFKIDLNSGKLVKGRKLLICQGHAITSLSSRSWMSREARDPYVLISVAANMLCLYKVTGTGDGNLEFKKKFPIRHSRQGQQIRSNFCPLMSFRQGACVLSGSEDSCVYLFDVEKEGGSQPCVNKLQGHSCAVTDVVFNHDESFLASADQQGTVIIWKRQKKEFTPSPL